MARFVVLLLATLVWSAPAKSATFLWLSVPNEHSLLAVSQFKQELAQIVAPTQIDLKWVNIRDGASPIVDGRSVRVSLIGNCSSRSHTFRVNGPLGSTAVSDGQILPIVEVDCDRIHAVIAGELAQYDPAIRDVFFGKALARVLAHELRHALANVHEHNEEVLSKVGLSGQDLTLGTVSLLPGDLTPAKPMEAEVAETTSGISSVAVLQSPQAIPIPYSDPAVDDSSR